MEEEQRLKVWLDFEIQFIKSGDNSLHGRGYSTWRPPRDMIHNKKPSPSLTCGVCFLLFFNAQTIQYTMITHTNRHALYASVGRVHYWPVLCFSAPHRCGPALKKYGRVENHSNFVLQKWFTNINMPAADLPFHTVKGAQHPNFAMSAIVLLFRKGLYHPIFTVKKVCFTTPFHTAEGLYHKKLTLKKRFITP